jgi:hypothetical protein
MVVVMPMFPSLDAVLHGQLPDRLEAIARWWPTLFAATRTGRAGDGQADRERQ